MIPKLKKLTQNQNIMRYAKNSVWMLAEYALKIVSAIFVTIYVARYLGPEQFGLLSYVLAIVAIFMAISRLGMESILVRDIAKYPDQSQAYMSTAFGLMIMAAIAGLVAVSTLIYFIETDPNTQIYIWIIASGILFQTLLVIDYNFQAQVKAKFSSIAKSMALGLSSIIKIYLVWIEADLVHFAIAYAVDHAIIGIMLIMMHLHKKQLNFITGFNRALVKPLLKSAWPMVMLGLTGLLLMKFDQIYLKLVLGPESVGLYVAALRVYEGWIILPQVLMMSLIPALANLKNQNSEDYEKAIVKVFRLIAIVNLVVCIMITVYAKEVVTFLYGSLYVSSVPVLQVIIWCSVIMGIGSVMFRVLINEGCEKKIVNIMIVALILNVIFNVVFVGLYGIIGSAYAMLLSLLFSYVFYDFFDKDLMFLKNIKMKAIYVK